MADSFNVWPSNVPTSYSGEPFPWPQYQSLPGLYGIDLTNPFFLSFLIGAAFVAFFSVARFNQRSQDPSDPVTAESRLLQELTPMDLRDPRLIAQSYVLYVAVLLGVYTALTFYGSAILKWVNNVLPVAGYTTDLGQYDFTSPQWPLFVALGMIGVLPVLKPVEAVEIRLRRWTHRAVGIPLTIYRHSEALRLQYRINEGGKPGGGPLLGPTKVPEWLRKAVDDDRAINEGFEAREQLHNLADWVKDGRGEWPSGQSDRPMERLFDLQYAKAQEALRGFREIIDPKNAAAGPLPDDQKDPPAIAEHQARHIAKLRDGWDKAAKDVIEARDSVLALLAVGAEKQSNYALITNPKLRALVSKAVHVDDFQKGPQIGIFLLLTPMFFVYAAAIFFNHHAPFTGGNHTRVSVVAIAATYEVLLICAVFLFPLMAAMNYRFWRKVAYRNRWEQLHMLDFEQKSMLQVLSATVLAFVVSVIGLTLLAVAQAGIVSRGTSEFHRLLVDAGIPLLQASLGLTGVTVIFCLAVLFAVEERENLRAAAASNGGKSKASRTGQAIAASLRFLGLGVLTALAVLGYLVAHTYFWISQVVDPPFCDNGGFFLELFRPRIWMDGTSLAWCSRWYGLTSLVLYSLLAFLAVTVLIPKQRRQPSGSTRRAAASRRPSQEVMPAGAAAPRHGTAAVLLVTVLILTLTVGNALGQDREAATPDSPVSMVTDRTAVVGFRSDTPPFSYLRQFGDEKRYAGYLAQFCNLIFAGDATHAWTMVATTVGAHDRFERLVRHPDEHWTAGQPIDDDTKVDMLCDPITLRYSAELSERPGASRTDGIFSPIVYVTGVSHLARSSGGSNASLGFVAGTTAGRVAVEACSRDGLRIRDQSAGFDPDTVENCRKSAARAEEMPFVPGVAGCQRIHFDFAKAEYELCAFNSHTALIEWFCSKGVTSKRFYFGDKDLIIGQYEAWQEAGHVCDGVTTDYPFRTYEPYALLISKVNPDLVQFVQRRIYEIFSDREQVLGLFAGNFRGKAMSTPLANLFNLNGVEDKLELAPETLGATLSARH